MSLPIEELWRPVPGYKGLYEVSDHGRVRSVDRVIVRSNGHPQTCHSQVLAPSADEHGRLAVHLYREGHGKPYGVHILVLLAFHGSRPAGMVGCHNDGNVTNNRPGNLRWDTLASNSLDMVQHGTHNNASKTRCPRRHLLSGRNLIPSALRRGNRECLACNRAAGNVRYAKRTGRAYDMDAWADDHYAQIMRIA